MPGADDEAVEVIAGAHLPITFRRRAARVCAAAALLGAALAAVAVTSGVVPAQAATPGTPFVCNPSLYFQSINNPTQLDEETYNAHGGLTFTEISAPQNGLEYNALGYNPIDNYLYASTSNLDGSQELVRIDADGTQVPQPQDVLPAAFIAATFDPSGDYLGVYPADGQDQIFDMNVDTGSSTETPMTLDGTAYGQSLTDWTYSYGYLWSHDNSTTDATANDIVRIDPTTGDMVAIPQSSMPNGTYGADWTFGNGNLVFSNNSTGEVYQLLVNDPTSASPSVTGVSQAQGVATSNNDGASCIGPNIDLSMSKTGPASVPVSSPISWTLTVTDTSDVDDSSGYTVTDPVPTGFTNVTTNTPDTCTVTDNDVVCVEPQIDAEQSVQIVVSATSPATGGVYTNTATVIGNEGDPNPSNNSSSVTTHVGFADVTLQKSATTDTPDVGSNDTFTLTAANSPTSTADSGEVVVTDPLPAGLSYQSSSSATCPSGSCIVVSGQTVTWTIPDLAPNSSAQLSIVVTVDTSASVTNVASFTQAFPGPGGVTSGTSNSVTLSPQWADVSLAKSVTVADPDVGTQDTFTLTATNSAASTVAAGVTVTDVLPTGLTYASSSSATCPSGSCITDSGQTVTWAISSLTAGASATLQIVVSVTGTASVTNTATFTQTVPNDQGKTSGSSNTVPVSPVYADVTVTKSATATTPEVGSTDTFTLQATDSGPDTAGQVVVTDSVPAGAELQSAGSPVGTVDVSGQTVTWTIPSLADADSDSLTINVLVMGTTPVTNTASFTQATPNSSGQTSGSSNSVTLTPQFADVSVAKSVSSATPTVGSQDTFTLDATNADASSADSGTVTLVDPLPAGLDYASSSATNSCTGACVSVSGQTVTWTIDGLAPGATATLTIVVTVASSAQSTNTAAFTQSVPNGVGGTSGSSNSVTVTPSFAAVTVSKTVSSATPTVGAHDTFTLTAANAAASTTDSGQVTVTDPLPSNLTYVSSTASNTCPPVCITVTGQTVVWTITDLAIGASATLQIVVTVASSGQATNTATFTQANPNGSGQTTGSSNSVVVTPPYAAVTLTKSASTTTPQLGSDDTFTVTASNAGPASSGKVVATDVLASGLTYESSSASLGTVSVSGQTVTWTVPNLGPPGDQSSATLQIVVLVGTTSGVTNKVSFTQQTPDATGGTSGSSNTVSLTPAYAKLHLSKVVSDPSPDVGTEGTYTITVSDAGPDAAKDVVVTDDLPAGIQFVSVSSSTGSASESTVDGVQVVAVDVGLLAVNAQAIISIVVKFTAAGTVVNTATATDSTFNRSSTGGEVAEASVSAAVIPGATVPLTNTGEPWSGWPYWLLVGLFGAAGLFMVESARRRRCQGMGPA
jgi:uncharacterized repeat protein (TIGR01451 family)/fimbrial isopeptide formation D2 family protein